MAYEEISDVKVVVLGGTDKKTGKPNPIQIEGYLVRVEQRKNKFHPDVPQNFYVFKTKEGERGVYAKAGINSALKNAKFNVMTMLIATDETLDTGKGNPMKVFKAKQDPKNTYEGSAESAYSDQEDTSDDDLFEESTPMDEAPTARPNPPARAAQAPSAERQKRVQDLIAGRAKRAP